MTGGAGGGVSRGLSRLFPSTSTPNLDHAPTAPAGSGAVSVASGDGVVVDTLANPATNAVSLGHYPAYVEMAQQTGARTFSMSDEAWSRCRPTSSGCATSASWTTPCVGATQLGLATPLDEVRPGSYFERELQHLVKNGCVPSVDGLSMVPG